MIDDAAPTRTDDFDFDLPSDLIAQTPAVPRDSARLLEVGPSIRDSGIMDLPSLLREGDLLLVNDTKVIPVRLDGRRDDTIIEITLHKETAPGKWLAFAKPGRKLRPGDAIIFAPGFEATVADKTPDGQALLEFSEKDLLVDRLRAHGRMPLPPYIRRSANGIPADVDDYQTIYAAHDGAVAAPTAGLHFTDALFSALTDRDIGVARLTLHVGAGTFLPVRVDDIRDHKMHAERGWIDDATADAINAARDRGGRIVAVGTTSLRLLESAADETGRVHPFDGETDIFISPGYNFRAVDLLMTNFHLPRSTLFMLVSAFAGLDRMRRAYTHAIAERYRFYSYGDATLLHRGDPA